MLAYFLSDQWSYKWSDLRQTAKYKSPTSVIQLAETEAHKHAGKPENTQSRDVVRAWDTERQCSGIREHRATTQTFTEQRIFACLELNSLGAKSFRIKYDSVPETFFFCVQNVLLCTNNLDSTNEIISAARATFPTKHVSDSQWQQWKKREPEKFPGVLARLKNYNFIQFEQLFLWIVFCVSGGSHFLGPSFPKRFKQKKK